MKLGYIVLFVFFGVLNFSCQKNQESISTNNKNAFNIKKHKNYADTLFLGFSPSMTNKEFDSLKKEGNDKRLDKGTFPILISNQKVYFYIRKKRKSILLNYNELISESDINNNENINLFNGLFNILNEKYFFHTSPEFPNHREFDKKTNTFSYINHNNPAFNLTNPNSSKLKPLSYYGFPDTNYAVFSDSFKTIVISFSTKLDSNAEFMSSASNSNSPSKLGYISNGETTSSQDKSLQTTSKDITPLEDRDIYNFNINIEYFLIKDFDSIKNNMKSDYGAYRTALDSISRVNSAKKTNDKLRLKNNVNEL